MSFQLVIKEYPNSASPECSSRPFTTFQSSLFDFVGINVDQRQLLNTAHLWRNGWDDILKIGIARIIESRVLSKPFQAWFEFWEIAAKNQSNYWNLCWKCSHIITFFDLQCVNIVSKQSYWFHVHDNLIWHPFGPFEQNSDTLHKK